MTIGAKSICNCSRYINGAKNNVVGECCKMLQRVKTSSNVKIDVRSTYWTTVSFCELSRSRVACGCVEGLFFVVDELLESSS